MVPTFTNLQTTRDATNRTTYTTGSIAPGADRLLAVFVSATSTAAITVPSLSGGGVSTFTLVGGRTNSVDRGVWMFRALTGSSPTTGAISIDFSGVTQANCEWSVIEVADCLLTGTNGEDAIADFYTSATPSGTSTSHSVTLTNGWGADDNRAVAAFHHASASATFIAGTGFTLLGQTLGSGFNAGLATEYGRDVDTGVDMSAIDAVAWRAVVAEIAGGGGSAPPPDPETVLLTRLRRRGLNGGVN